MRRRYGDTKIVDLLQRASQVREIPQQEISSLPANRQTIVATVSRYARDSNFRQQVLNAYDDRCAVTRAQLRLVEAAHIIPVPSDTSIDHITNGIALSPTMHRAFDNALIFLDEDCHMRLNERKVRELRTENLHAGLNQFRTYLNKVVYLPADRSQWPNTQFIRDANRLRRIAGY